MTKSCNEIKKKQEEVSKSETINKIDFNTLYNKSIKNEEENYISIEDNSKVFSNIVIESFTVHLTETSTINNIAIPIGDLVRIPANKTGNHGYGHIIFRDCTIAKLEIKTTSEYKISFENCEIENFIIKAYESKKTDKDIIINGGSINKFEIQDSTIDVNLHINHNSTKNLKINSLTVTNTDFEKDFSFHSCSIDEVKINDCDFHLLSEFNECKFKEKFDLSEITYKGFTLFDNCIFCTKAEFKYVIFEKFASFRESEFNQGINLEYASRDKEIHFFGVKGLESDDSKQNTSQETYRIIKYNFEKLGNKIEANKYHAFELEQRRKELEKSIFTNMLDYLVFKAHWISSEHSTNWLLPVLWMFSIGIIFASFSLEQYEDLFFISIFPVLALTLNGFVKSLTDKKFMKYKNTFVAFLVFIIYVSLAQQFNIKLDDVIKNISLIHLDKEHITLTFVNKIIMGYLYYQFLMSVRKDTRK